MDDRHVPDFGWRAHAEPLNFPLMQYLDSDEKNTELSEVGGKAANLYKLRSFGLNVPDWIVLPQTVLAAIIEADDDEKAIREKINAYVFPPDFIEKIRNRFPDTEFFAVRSSTIDEDGSSNSFAGAFESYLYVKPENIPEHVRKVWLSVLSERVQSYRKLNGLPPQYSIAVIIQCMVNAEAAGVGFGMDPVSGSRSKKLISAVYGLGEGLVSGELDADTYTISAKGIEKQIAHKTNQIILDAEKGGTLKTSVKPELSDRPVLTDAQVSEVAQTLDKLREAYGKPQDIEFAYEGVKLYLLQARPVTGLHKIADPEGDSIVWDNSNIIESYPGVTTPLTFSFISKVYEAVYKQFSAMMGISAKDIAQHENTYANMLGLLDGRVYYNLLSWFKLLSLLPGYSLNAPFMEKMMGVKERFELKDLAVRTRFRERLRVLNMVRIMLRNLRTLPRQRKEFIRDFNTVMQRFQGIDFNKCRPEELMRLYLDFEGTLLKRWKAPLVNDFFTMIYFGVLQKMIAGYKIEGGESLQNDLLCGAKDIISTQPIKLTLELTEQVLSSPEAKALFETHSPEEIWTELEKDKLPQLKKNIDSFLRDFGERCVGELKLETVSYKQQPALFIKVLKSYVMQGVKRNTANEGKELDIRRAAGQKINRHLKGKPFKKMLFRYFLNRSRSLVSNRENLRYERTRAFGIVREIFTAIGRQFFAENLITHPRDIFFLTKEEIFSHIQGTSVSKDLSRLIAFRKEEFRAFEDKSAAERIHTKGIVYQGNNFNSTITEAVLEGDLKGLGCCPGRVKAKVRVLTRPDEIASLEGDILVTSSTDPGWAILFPTASAILVERGSLLSHSAIVSREMGIPCIVGVTGLLQRLKTGDTVEMDGATGDIKIIDNKYPNA
jgi:pyruvate,water dikinase